MIVADVQTEKADFVRIVNAAGDPIPGFTEPVPSTWIGTPLLPEGAKKAPDAAEPELPDADAADDKGGDPAPARGRRSV